MMAMAGGCATASCPGPVEVYPTNVRKCVVLPSFPEEIGDKAACWLYLWFHLA